MASEVTGALERFAERIGPLTDSGYCTYCGRREDLPHAEDCVVPIIWPEESA